MKIKVKLNGGFLPSKNYKDDGAYDVRVPKDVRVKTGRNTIDLGFAVEIPRGYGAIIQPRSGFTSKGIECEYGVGSQIVSAYKLDADVELGLVDSTYRGNVGATIKVHEMLVEDEYAIIKKGTRVAQMRIVEIPDTELEECDELSPSPRGENGFGSTGIH